MCTLIWKWVQFLEEVTFLLIFFLLEVRFGDRREFKEVLKFLSKRNGKDLV